MAAPSVFHQVLFELPDAPTAFGVHLGADDASAGSTNCTVIYAPPTPAELHAV
jgi:hypothetical protein